MQGAVEFVEESEFVAGAGGLGQRGEGYAHGWFGKPEAAGDFGVADHLEHAGDEGAQALAGDDIFFKLAFKVSRHALGHVRGEPPTGVTSALRGLGHGTLEPDALVFDGAQVGESDEWEIVGESDHEKVEGCGMKVERTKRGWEAWGRRRVRGWSARRGVRFFICSTSSMNSPASWNCR